MDVLTGPAVTTPAERLSEALSGRYRIERELGAGGMATVYLAHDERHDRKVAIKVLKAELAAVLGAERFVVEIKTTAALSHPHILPLFDSGTAGGFLFYVMPFIEGETIRDKLNRETQFGVDEAVRIAREVADALDYAHRHGVIHRDIKPENILLHDGRAMVMDFGIALAVSAAAGGRMTETGLSLGTPHYMSPEQATAEKDLTSRSDLYSLATVVFEMLTGNPPHTGATAQQIIMKIITEPAESVAKYRKSVPPHVVAAVAKAIEKLPADRFESAKMFADALANPAFTSAGATAVGTAAVSASGGRHRRLSAAASAIAVMAMVGLAWSLARPRGASDARVVTFIMATPESLTPTPSSPYSAAISPDGRLVLYAIARPGGGSVLQLFRTDQLDTRTIPGSEDGTQPAFSPDGQSILFESGGKLRRMRLDGGTPTVVSDGGSNDGVAWTKRDEIILGADAGFHGLSRINASGGVLTQLTRPDTGRGETEHWYPVVLDDNRTVVFSIIKGFVATGELAITSLDDTKVTRLGVNGFRPLAVIDGTLVYLQVDGTVMAIELDARGRRVSGDPVPVYGPVPAGAGNGEIFISQGGALVNSTLHFRRQLVWFGRDGSVRPVSRDVRGYADASLAPDGSRVAVTIADGQATDIWIRDLATSALTRLTSMQSVGHPVWSNDNRHVFFLATSRDGTPAIWSQAVDGGSAATKRADVTGIPSDFALSPDGRTLLYTTWNRSNYVLYTSKVDSAGSDRVFLDTKGWLQLPSFSPDGRWVAFSSAESGTREIYIRSFADPRQGLRVSAGGGVYPQWAVDGTRLFYEAGTGIVEAKIAISASGVQVTARDTVLRTIRATRGPSGAFEMSVARDGTKFLGLLSEREGLQLVVSPNWVVELREKLGAARKKR
jgi:serine/threonine-protein kinase